MTQKGQDLPAPKFTKTELRESGLAREIRRCQDQEIQSDGSDVDDILFDAEYTCGECPDAANKPESNQGPSLAP